MKIITSAITLLQYAKELGEAKKSGDKDRIEKAQKKHDEYKEMCLRSDYMCLGTRTGDIK
jgi:hypothetical protein